MSVKVQPSLCHGVFSVLSQTVSPFILYSKLRALVSVRHPSSNHWHNCKLQALVYDILPSTTAVFSYAIGPRKLSANEQFFVGAQTVVSLLQTTQIKQACHL